MKLLTSGEAQAIVRDCQRNHAPMLQEWPVLLPWTYGRNQRSYICRECRYQALQVQIRVDKEG
jgi:hypothetical protein